MENLKLQYLGCRRVLVSILGQPFMVSHLGQPLLEITKMAPVDFHTSLKSGPHLKSRNDPLASKNVVLHQTSYFLFPLKTCGS